MTINQKTEFEQRRLAVMRAHIKKDPKVRQIRRKRKRAVLGSVLGSLVALGVAFILIKSFILTLEGQGGYARIVAPVLDGLDEESLLMRALGPDPVSTEIAAFLRPIFRDTPDTAAPEGVIAPLNLSSSESESSSEPATTP